jgi:hypothetical protein
MIVSFGQLSYYWVSSALASRIRPATSPKEALIQFQANALTTEVIEDTEEATEFNHRFPRTCPTIGHVRISPIVICTIVPLRALCGRI